MGAWNSYGPGGGVEGPFGPGGMFAPGGGGVAGLVNNILFG